MMLAQTTDTLVMVRPASFAFNKQTALDNSFQQTDDLYTPQQLQQKALQEFNRVVSQLQALTIDVLILEDTLDPKTPDAMFANNWISFHANGMIGVYPMFAENRRLERRELLLSLVEESGFYIESVIDYTTAEQQNMFLEGTGSFVLDRVHKKAYASLSDRTDEDLFIEFCEDFEYTPVIFNAQISHQNVLRSIYHTNVMLSIGVDFAIIALDAITDKKERKAVVSHLKQDGKQIISITSDQMMHFAANVLEVQGKDKKRYLIMSTTAYDSLTPEQRIVLEQKCTVVAVCVDTIQKYAGGGVRCMLTEVFLPKL